MRTVRISTVRPDFSELFCRHLYRRLYWHAIYLLWVQTATIPCPTHFINTNHNTPILAVTRNSSRHKCIVCAISLSYCAYSTVAILEWYHDHSALVNHSETRDALFAALFAGSQWPILVTDIMDFIMAAVADGILVRRGEHPAKRFLAMAEIIQCSLDMALLPCLRGFIPCSSLSRIPSFF